METVKEVNARINQLKNKNVVNEKAFWEDKPFDSLQRFKFFGEILLLLDLRDELQLKEVSNESQGPKTTH